MQLLQPDGHTDRMSCIHHGSQKSVHRTQVLRPDAAAAYGAMSLGTYLERHGYSEAFKRNYLLPMCAAVWSVPNAQVRSRERRLGSAVCLSKLPWKLLW